MPNTTGHQSQKDSSGSRSPGRVLRLLSEYPLPPSWDWNEDRWESIQTSKFSLSEVAHCDLVAVDGDVNILSRLVAAGFLSRKWHKPIIAVDVVLRPPKNMWQRRLFPALFKRIPYFIHYFRDLSGYEKYYGIGTDRSAFVEFKANLRYRHEPNSEAGEYVLCFGGSMRDYDTFLAALDGAAIPGAISEITAKQLSEAKIPQNIRVLPDDNTQESLIRIIEGARVVALPIRPDNICASGLSTYLNSMLLGKAVILTEGPGVSDILNDQALIIEPQNPASLRKAIERLWSDDKLRCAFAEQGRKYAESLGGDPEFCARLRDAMMDWYYGAHRSSRNST